MPSDRIGAPTVGQATNQSARRNRRPRNPQGEGARLRDELIAAADRILARTGDEEGLSLRAVAREAGIAAPSIYLHFANKQELVTAVMLGHFAGLKRAVETGVAGADNDGDRLRAGCLGYCRFALEQPGAYRVMFGAWTTALGDLPFDRMPGADAFGLLVLGVGECVRAGIVPPGDPFALATAVWTALHGVVSLRRAIPNFPWPSLEEQIEDILVGLVGLPRRGGTGGRAAER